MGKNKEKSLLSIWNDMHQESKQLGLMLDKLRDEVERRNTSKSPLEDVQEDTSREEIPACESPQEILRGDIDHKTISMVDTHQEIVVKELESIVKPSIDFELVPKVESNKIKEKESENERVTELSESLKRKESGNEQEKERKQKSTIDKKKRVMFSNKLEISLPSFVFLFQDYKEGFLWIKRDDAINAILVTKSDGAKIGILFERTCIHVLLTQNPIFKQKSLELDGSAYKLHSQSKFYDDSSMFVSNPALIDVDSRTNPFEERGNDENQDALQEDHKYMHDKVFNKVLQDCHFYQDSLQESAIQPLHLFIGSFKKNKRLHEVSYKLIKGIWIMSFAYGSNCIQGSFKSLINQFKPNVKMKRSNYIPICLGLIYHPNGYVSSVYKAAILHSN